MEFQVGDAVSFAGAYGSVEERDGNFIFVRFLKQETLVTFTSTGKAEMWHPEPLLKLIERPQKKKKVWVNLYRDTDSLFYKGYEHKTENGANAAASNADRMRLACVEIEIDE